MEAFRDLLTSLGLLQPLLGGVLIGLAAVLLWLLEGRVAGISGIAGGLLDSPRGDRRWRLWFVLGLLVGGAVMWRVLPGAFGVGAESGANVASSARGAHAATASSASAGVEGVLGSGALALVLASCAGLLVGVGTSLSRGCTSGHGVCGISRLSRRSIIATATFMATGAMTALVAGRLISSLSGGEAS